MTANSSSVEAVRELARVGHPERVGVAVEVEARDRGEAHPLVELGPGLAGEDLDAVAERDQLAGEVPGVDALAAAAWVAPVDEEGDAQPAGPGGRRARREGPPTCLERSQDSWTSPTSAAGSLGTLSVARGSHDRTASPDPQSLANRASGVPGAGPTSGGTPPATLAATGAWDARPEALARSRAGPGRRAGPAAGPGTTGSVGDGPDLSPRGRGVPSRDPRLARGEPPGRLGRRRASP